MSSLEGKKVLVTGADGFIGSHLVQALVREGCSVRALVCYNSFGNRGWLEELSADELPHVDVVLGDIRDPHAVLELVDSMAMVFHLAALIAIPYSYVAPESYIATNITGTLNVLQAARRVSPERVLITSTSEVYGTAKYVPIDENHPFQGQSPYAASKIGADRLAESFMRSYDLPVTIVRPFNTYGPRQSARAVIPTIIAQILQGKKEILLGNLEPTRDFVFVQDTVEGFIQVARSEKTSGQEVNIATGQETSIGALAQMIAGILDSDARVTQDPHRIRPRDSEVERLCGSNKKICQLTTWRPRHGLETGLRETIDWFSRPANLSRYRADIYHV